MPSRMISALLRSSCPLLVLLLIGAYTFRANAANERSLDAHSNADFLQYLHLHVGEYRDALASTQNMYRRIGQLGEQLNPGDKGPAPVRIQARMAEAAECSDGVQGGQKCEQYRFLAEKLMPAALQEVSRRYVITSPLSGPLRLPRLCKSTLPSGSCAEVSSLSKQPPMCQNPVLYAGYELCKYVDGNLHCVTMQGGKGVADTDFLLMVSIDGSTSNKMPDLTTMDASELPLTGIFDDSTGKNDGSTDGYHEVPDFMGRRLLSSVDSSFDFSALCGTAGMIAYTGHCGYDLKTGRPLAGYISFCPSAINPNGNFDDMLEDAVHQIIHAIYMSGSLIPLYRPSHNNGRGYGIRGSLFREDAPELSSPAVVEAARQHFGCNDINGVELEYVPDSGGILSSHWATRWLAGELMTPHQGPHPSVLTSLTAAMADDSGWYMYVSRIKPGVLHYGLNASCAFLREASKCEKPSQIANSKYFCSKASDKPSCTYGELGHGMCSEISGMPDCYTPAGDGAFHNCRDPRAAGDAFETMFGVYHGYKGRCLEVADPITVQLGLKSEVLSPGAQCFKFECKNDELFVVLGFVQVRCPSGAYVDVAGLDLDAGFRSGRLGPCPDNGMTCGALQCPNECSGHGECDPLYSSPTCGCSLGYGFNRLDIEHEDCSISRSCTSDSGCAPLTCNDITGSCGFSVSAASSTAEVPALLRKMGLTRTITGLFDAIDIFATTDVDDKYLAHVAAVIVSVMDMDQDGKPDDSDLIRSLQDNKPVVAIYADEIDRDRMLLRQKDLTKWEQATLKKMNMQSVFASEIRIMAEEEDAMDAGLHIVLKLLFTYGWSEAYAGLTNSLTEAMDEAAGNCGYFYCGDDTSCGKWTAQPCSGIFHDGQDRDCEHDCLLPEYFALAVSASLGALERRGACNSIASVWSACSQSAMQSQNPRFFDIITDYRPASRRHLLGMSPGRSIVDNPFLPIGREYRQYDAASFHLSQPLPWHTIAPVQLTIDARAGGDDSESDSSSSDDSSQWKRSGYESMYGFNSENSHVVTEFYSVYGIYGANAPAARSGNNDVVVVGGGKIGSLEDRQTWEQLVLGLIASMEGRQEGAKVDTTTVCARDRFNQCCNAPSVLDAAQGCCTTNVDSCGVCNGGDASCALHATVRVAAREDLEIEMLVSSLKNQLGKLLARFMITPDHITIDISGMEQVSRRRLLSLGSSKAEEWGASTTIDAITRRAALEQGWVEVDVPFAVYPPDFHSNLEQPLVSEAADFLSQVSTPDIGVQPDGMRIESTVQVDVTGVCGNHICEWGEMGVLGGEPGACPQDCPAADMIGGATSPLHAGALEAGGFSSKDICPDITTVCAGNDAQACYEATVAASTAECLAYSGLAAVELPPVNAATIMPCPLDALGVCCAAPATVDASGRCCRDLFGVDACGVCGGKGKSCVVTALLRVAAPATLEVKSFIANVKSTVRQLLNITSNSSNEVQVNVESLRRLPKDPSCSMMGGVAIPAGVVADSRSGNSSQPTPDTCKFGDDWLRLEFPVSVLPGVKPAPGAAQVNQAIARAVASASPVNGIVVTAVLKVFSAGVCGNAVCETSEANGSCPQDCPSIVKSPPPAKPAAPPAPKIRCPVPESSEVASPLDECGGRGTCNPATGLCWCKPGYSGKDCSMCADGYYIVNNGCGLAPVASLLPTVESTTNATTEPNKWFIIVLVAAGAGCCLLIVVLVIGLLMWRRSKRARQDAYKGKGAEGDTRGTPWEIPTAGAEVAAAPSVYVAEHANAPEAIHKEDGASYYMNKANNIADDEEPPLGVTTTGVKPHGTVLHQKSAINDQLG